MKVLSLFSGVGGMDMGLERVGHEIVGMCEIDKKARSVLARHWPDVPIHDDVTTFETEAWRGRVDLVAGGSPCQDLSVAGKRAGLDGQRSSLFWHQCRIADSVAADWFLWENVSGVLTSNKGADFAAVLWGITGALPVVPDGGWRSAGICVGPKRTAVWRLLDAQWFGVAQRRRRVFVVAGPRGECRPEVLLESEGMFGDSTPSNKSEEGTADGIAGGADEPTVFGMSQFAGYTEGVTTLTATDYKRPEQNIVVPGVRRLTPRECERLMGWPDDWTRYDADGNEVADSHRYKMCGNGVVSNVTEWIGGRL